jgi:endonuclease/exonuclease/phosphatase family metal-dependent hydrolase
LRVRTAVAKGAPLAFRGVSTQSVSLHPRADRPRWAIVVALVAISSCAAAVAGPAKPWDAVLIASFNIQVFGESKMAKPQVVDALVRVVRNFDIVAIQEVRAKSDSIIPEFVRRVNADGSRYHFVIGPRQGRTVSKEQYTFVYDTDRIEVDTASVGIVPDPGGRLHRPPMHARFRTKVIPQERAFSFWLVDIHTDPDEVPQELEALTDVFLGMQRARPDEDDVILLGDLNAGPPQFRSFQRIPNVAWAVSGVPTNTRRNKTYDNLVFTNTATREYLGAWGVFDLQIHFGLPLEAALEISDHNPVWAAFHPCEAPGQPPMQGYPGMAATPAASRQ